MSFDEPTQRIRRPEPPLPMPGPLDQTRPRPPSTAPPEPDETGVLPLDELLGPPDGAQARPELPARAPMPVVTVRSESAAAGRSGPATWDRLRSDASTVLRAGSARFGEWLRRGDNAVVLATLLVAVLLLSVIATVG